MRVSARRAIRRAYLQESRPTTAPGSGTADGSRSRPAGGNVAIFEGVKMSSEEALRGHLVRAKTALIHAAITARIVRSELNNPRANVIADAVDRAAGAVGDAVAELTAAR